MKAIWNGATLAESNETIIIENNHYFPPQSVNKKFFKKTNHHTECPWKGTAYYYSISVEDEKNENAAWYYPEPKKAAKEITNYIAFWHGVEVHE